MSEQKSLLDHYNETFSTEVLDGKLKLKSIAYDPNDETIWEFDYMDAVGFVNDITKQLEDSLTAHLPNGPSFRMPLPKKGNVGAIGCSYDLMNIVNEKVKEFIVQEDLKTISKF
jgi:hypothetical protein